MILRAFAPLLLALSLSAVHCGKDAASAPEAGTMASATPTSTAAAATSAAASSAPRPSNEPTAPVTTPAPTMPELAALEKELRSGIPKGSGDYARALALATLHKRGTITFEQLEAAVVAMKLPPHKLGDGYLMMSAPPPPPGVKFDPKDMPKDWEGTWGEVAMAYHLGVLDKASYNKLHQAAHPTGCKI